MHPNGTPSKRPVGRPSLRVTQTCATCGTPFQTKRSEVARGGGRFCGKACYALSQTGPKVPLAERVWEKVNKDGPTPEHCPERGPCWEWTAAIGKVHGYGLINVEGRAELAHRVVWGLVVGPEDRDLLHHCDNRRCVHVDPDPAVSHLYPGTDLDNQRDARERGRAVLPPQPTAEQRPRGERHGNAKLSEVLVRHIRLLSAEGWPQTAIAQEVGVNQTTVSRVLLRQIWAHVE